MKKYAALGCLAAAIVFLVVAVFLFFYALGIYNTQQTNLNLYEAKISANKAELSNLKSKLPEAAQVTDAQMRKLQELFEAYANARTADTAGAIMQWTQETVPTVDQTTFLNLQNLVAATRDNWTRNQLELVDLARVCNTPLDRQPSGFVLGLFGFEKVEAKVIVTADTNRAFETGTDEKLNLF